MAERRAKTQAYIGFQLGHFLAEMDRFKMVSNDFNETQFQLGHFLAEMDSC